MVESPRHNRMGASESKGTRVSKDEDLIAARKQIAKEVAAMEKLNDTQLVMLALSAIVLSIDMPLVVQQSLFQGLRKRAKVTNGKKRILHA